MEEQVQLYPQTNTLAQCPICRSGDLQGVINLPQIPVLCNVIWDQRADALTAPRADVNLVFCPTCGHVFNQAFDPARMEYDVQYENSLHFSPRFQRFATWLAHHLVDQYDLHGKSIVEIGSGKGDFLRMLCEYGGNVGTGFDPSYEPSPDEKHPAMSFVRDVYTERYADYQADLILSRHVLEHIYQPYGFMESLRRTIGDRKRTLVYFEVPNFNYILRDTAIWDLIYEHYSYFSPHSLADLFTRTGFIALNLAEGFEGQFLYIEAMPRDATRPAPNAAHATPVKDLARQVNGFARRSREKVSRWQEQIAGLRSNGKKAVVWGAGSKGISFLNLLHLRDEIEYIIDINPRKRGKFVTGTGQQIVPPDFLTTYRPDTVIIMNPIYRQEIQSTLAQMGLQPEIMLAV